MSKTKVDLDQTELKLLVAVILSQKYTLGDSLALIPLVQKFESYITPVPKIIEKTDKIVN